MSKPRTRQLVDPTLVRLADVRLQVSSGADKGRFADLSGALVVGTAEDCDLVLHDTAVSGHHFELARLGDGIVLRDLGSTNGVWVDGTRVKEVWPRPGARIRAGETQLVLKHTGEDALPVSASTRFGALFGRSALMRALFAQLERVAGSEAPLLIEGETGTGKSAAAHAVHEASPRAKGPFAVFDCGAVARELIEAELFGHERGAFSGASEARPGVARTADGGTLVLDEIGELPLDLQPKLLRLIERKEVRAVGAAATVSVDARIVACTHRSLEVEVKAGRFREDLFFRVGALHVRVPSLRERPEDVPGLVDALLDERHSPLRFAELSPGDRAMLLEHRWPGNVRELRNVAERLALFPGQPAVDLIGGAPQGPAAGREILPLSSAREIAYEAFERRYLQHLMLAAKGSVTEAARLSAVSRQFLHRLLRKHGIH